MKKSVLVQIIKEAVTAKRLLKEEKSLDQLMTQLGDAILADDDQAVKAAGKELLSMLKGKVNQIPGKLKAYIEKDDTNEGIDEGKPSAGLTAKEKSAVVKKAKAGKDIGKKGPGFAKVEKAAEKEYGSKEAGKKVAAAAMWKAQAAKKK